MTSQESSQIFKNRNLLQKQEQSKRIFTDAALLAEVCDFCFVSFEVFAFLCLWSAFLGRQKKHTVLVS